MKEVNQEEMEPHTNESCVDSLLKGRSGNISWKDGRRIPLADIRNVQENLSRKFDGE